MLFKYLKYKLTASHKGGHGIHSPFVFKLLTEIIENFGQYYSYQEIDDLRIELQNDKRKIEITDLGAGSKHLTARSRKISDIAKKSSTKKTFGEMLFRLVNYFQPKTILELGTSLGLSTCYLAKANSHSKIFTIEGCPETAKIATENFQKMEIKNVTQFIGNFNELLPHIITEQKNIDFVFFDGNHAKQPTIEYFNLCLKAVNNNTVFIFDDIHWSEGMEEAWKVIQNNEKVKVTIDLFFMGLVFFRKEMQKENYIINF